MRKMSEPMIFRIYGLAGFRKTLCPTDISLVKGDKKKCLPIPIF
jgi:hypothetical protein